MTEGRAAPRPLNRETHHLAIDLAEADRRPVLVRLGAVKELEGAARERGAERTSPAREQRAPEVLPDVRVCVVPRMLGEEVVDVRMVDHPLHVLAVMLELARPRLEFFGLILLSEQDAPFDLDQVGPEELAEERAHPGVTVVA